MATTDTAIIQIKLEDLHESPFNPRKHFDEAGLHELAEDIKAQGRILQPLLVRPRIPELFRGMEDAADTAACGYELVFGHRRLRAAQLAGERTAPCMVTSMSDLEVKRAQISENLQRRDVHPIEEAEGFQALIDDHAETADSIAEQTGKSRSYVYGRLKLLNLSPALREACLKGGIGAEAALLVARLRHHKLQDKALQHISARNQTLTDGGQQSFRRIRDLLIEHFTLDLKEAPFPLDDATLVPAAGDCQACPKRSGNAPEFADVANDSKRNQWSSQNIGPNVCTDPDCHQAKKVAIFKRQAEAMRAAGHEVVDGNKARAALDAYGKVRGSFVAASVATPKIAAMRKDISRKGLQPPKQVQLQDPRSGKLVPAYRLTDLQVVGIDLSIKPSAGADTTKRQAGESHEQRQARADAERKAADVELQRRLGLFHRLRTEVASRSERTADEARVVALALVEYARDSDHGGLLAELWGIERDGRSLDDMTVAWRDRVKEMTRDDIARLMIDCALMRGAVEVGYWEIDEIQPHGIDTMAALYGIDPAGPFPTPSTCCAGSEEAEDAGAPNNADEAPAGAGADMAAPAVAWPFPSRPPAGFKRMDDAGSAGEEQMDDAGAAGGRTATAEEASA